MRQGDTARPGAKEAVLLLRRLPGEDKRGAAENPEQKEKGGVVMFETADGVSAVYAKTLPSIGQIVGKKLFCTRLDAAKNPIGKTFRATVRMDAKGRLYIMSRGQRHYYKKEKA